MADANLQEYDSLRSQFDMTFKDYIESIAGTTAKKAGSQCRPEFFLYIYVYHLSRLRLFLPHRVQFLCYLPGAS